MSIVEFILARIAEEDAIAQAVPSWRNPGTDDPFIRHVCHHFPDRELRRSIAERQLLETATDDALKVTAAIWQDSPDYDPEWA